MNVKFPASGGVHRTIDEQAASKQIADVDSYRPSRGEPADATFETYLHCFRCGANERSFVPAEDGDAPLLTKLHAIVIDHGN